jgi:hypothetical protein
MLPAVPCRLQGKTSDVFPRSFFSQPDTGI